MGEEHLKFAGDWTTISSENVEEMLIMLKAPFMVRKAAPRLKPAQTISFNGTVMKINVVTTFKTKESNVPIDGSQFKDEMFGQVFSGKAEICEGGMIKTEGN